ncbi:MAG: DUF255 domain-containing protein, partial [Saprospiraceae bacterium]
ARLWGLGALVLLPWLTLAQGRQPMSQGAGSIAPRNAPTAPPRTSPPALRPGSEPKNKTRAEYDFPSPWAPAPPGSAPGGAYRGLGGPPPQAPVLPLNGVVNWLSLEEAAEKSKTDKRKIFVHVHTNWSAYAKKMDQEIFADPSVAAYLNERFLPVRLDAEDNREIRFKDKTYKLKNEGKNLYNELVQEWLGSRMTFPSSVFLDEQLNLIQSIPGYRATSQLLPIMQYFGEDYYKSIPWETFERKNKSSVD